MYTRSVEDLVRILSGVLQRMSEEARAHAPQECCGILAGREGVITHIFPAENVLASEIAFDIAPKDLFRIFRAIHEERLEHLGIYHSHPKSRLYPSPRDIELAYYPEAVYFIISPQPDAQPFARAFRIRDGVVSELPFAALGERNSF